MGGFPKLGVPLLGVPIIRTIVFWGLYWGPLILGNYHVPDDHKTKCAEDRETKERMISETGACEKYAKKE